MKENEAVPELSFDGGLLHQLGCRLGLVRGGTDTLRLGLALGLLTWGVLVLLSILQGTGHRTFSLVAIGAHVRLLLAIPLFFLCETWVFPMMAEFIRNIVYSELVPKAELPALALTIRRVNRLKDSWLMDTIFLMAAFALPALEIVVNVPGATGNWRTILGRTDSKLTLDVVWYLGFCLPLFRFLILRWLWQLGLWCYFLGRVEKLNLHLMPTHSDGAAGLGYLEVVQELFAPLVVAISAVIAASFAEGISSGTMKFEALYHLIPTVLVLNVAIFVAPLFIFSRKLWRCRVIGLSEYMAMASRYVHAFDHKWLRDEKVPDDSQLGTADIQSLADLTNSVRVVRDMRTAPVSRRLLLTLGVSAIIPLMPLLLLKYPIVELAEKVFMALAGL
jgi:hypothetical protein